MKRTLTTTRLALLLTGVVLTAGCGGDDTDPSNGPIKVGAIFDMTGPTSDVGTLYAHGIRDYVTWTNEQGGIDGREIDLLYQDYGYKVDQAEQLYSQFVGEGVVAFMGWGTGDTEALRGRIADDQIPFMSASYSHVLGDPEDSPYNFLSGTTYTDQFAILLDWILESSGAEVSEVALMHNASPFGLSPYEQGGRSYAESKGVTLSAHEMPRGSTDFTAQLTRIVESGAQWVVFQNTSAPAAVALKNAADLGLDLRFACLNWCSNQVLTELAGEAAEGVLGSVIYSPPLAGIEGLDGASEWLAAKGDSIEEKGLLYVQGWWTMGIMTEAIRRVAAAGPVTGEAIRASLEGMQGFSTGGVTAPVSFSADDHRGIKGMRIFRVEGGTWVAATGLRTAE